MLYLGACFVEQKLGPVGAVVLIFSFAQRFVSMKREELNPSNCRINMITVLRLLYNLNILLITVMVLMATFKSQKLLMTSTTWEQMLAPLYFFMTELLLIAIVSFVVLVNSVIQLCCNQSSRASRHSRAHNDANS